MAATEAREPREATETSYVETVTVSCDGGGGHLGHPRVFLSLEEHGEIDCPYCSHRFILAEGANQAAGH